MCKLYKLLTLFTLLTWKDCQWHCALVGLVIIDFQYTSQFKLESFHNLDTYQMFNSCTIYDFTPSPHRYPKIRFLPMSQMVLTTFRDKRMPSFAHMKQNLKIKTRLIKVPNMKRNKPWVMQALFNASQNAWRKSLTLSWIIRFEYDEWESKVIKWFEVVRALKTSLLDFNH